jgi:putative MATE family efflux protein
MLANEPISTLIWKLSLPASVGMLVNALYNVVDTIYIGHGVGAMGIAGLSIAFPVQMILGGTGTMLGIGAASVISRSLGAKNYKRAEAAFGNNLLAIAVIGFLIMLTGTLFTESILKIFGATEAILPYAYDYISVIFLGSPLIVFSISMNNVIRSEGAAKVAMLSMIIGAVANVILDPIFIFGLDMGIRGAALATVLARFLVIAWIFHYYRSGKSMLIFSIKYLKPVPGILWEILVIGFPSMLRHASSSFVFGLVNQLAGFYGGDVAIAIFGIMNRIIIFGGMPIFGITQGMQPILGYSYGAGYFHRAREVIKRSAVIATVFSSLITLILFVFPREVISLFTHSPELLEMGPSAMRMMTCGFFVIGFQIIGGTIFQAIGKGLPSFVLNTSRQVLILIPVLLILPRYLGLNGVWLSFPLSDILSTVITFMVVLPEMERLKNAELAVEGEM